MSGARGQDYSAEELVAEPFTKGDEVFEVLCTCGTGRLHLHPHDTAWGFDDDVDFGTVPVAVMR